MRIQYFVTSIDQTGIDVMAGIDSYLDRLDPVYEAEVPQRQYRHQFTLTANRQISPDAIPDYARITGMESAPFSKVYYFLTPALEDAATVDAWRFTATIDAWHTLFGNPGAGGSVAALQRGTLIRSDAGGELLGAGQLATEPEKPFTTFNEGTTAEAVSLVATYNTNEETPRKIMLVFPPTMLITGVWSLTYAINKAHDLHGATITVDAEEFTLDALLSLNVMPATLHAEAPDAIQIEDREWQGTTVIKFIRDRVTFIRSLNIPTSQNGLRPWLFGNQTSHIFIPYTAHPAGAGYCVWADGQTGTLSLQIFYGTEKLDLTPTTEVSIYTPASAEEQLLADIRDTVSISANVAGSVATVAGSAAAGSKIGATLGSSFGPWGTAIGAGVGLVLGGSRLFESIEGVQARKDGMTLQSNSPGILSCCYLTWSGFALFGIVSCMPVTPVNLAALEEEVRLYGYLTGGVRLRFITVPAVPPSAATHTFYQVDSPSLIGQPDQYLRAEAEAALARGVRIWDVRSDTAAGGYMVNW